MRKFNIFMLMLALTLPLFAGEWQIDKDNKDNLVKFISSTPVLDFEGVTEKIDGYLYWEGEALFPEGNQLYFEVDLNSVETGNGKRDRDMRNDVLETEKWPTTHFTGSIKSFEKADGIDNAYDVVAEGKMFIHGIEKSMEVQGQVIMKGDRMTISTNFSVFLKDFKIEAPSLLAFIKVAEEIKLQLNYTLKKVDQSN